MLQSTNSSQESTSSEFTESQISPFHLSGSHCTPASAITACIFLWLTCPLLSLYWATLTAAFSASLVNPSYQQAAYFGILALQFDSATHICWSMLEHFNNCSFCWCFVWYTVNKIHPCLSKSTSSFPLSVCEFWMHFNTSSSSTSFNWLPHCSHGPPTLAHLRISELYGRSSHLGISYRTDYLHLNFKSNSLFWPCWLRWFCFAGE